MSNFQDLNNSVQKNGIDEMGLIVESSNEPVYVDFEIEKLNQPMRKQLFQQLCAMVHAYKTTGQIWSDEILDEL